MNIAELPWDSSLFNFKVGYINLSKIIPEELTQITSDANNRKFHLLYIFCKERNTYSTINYPALIYTGQKTTFSKEINDDQKIAFQIQEYTSEGTCPDELLALAFLSGHFSRFKSDPNFKNDEFKKLYMQWIQKSISHEIADIVFTFVINNKIVGFITLKIHNEVCDIGLIATDSSLQGQGIGHQLILAAEHYAFNNKCSKLMVNTQRENKGAYAFYKSNGFTVYNTKEIYHLWL